MIWAGKDVLRDEVTAFKKDRIVAAAGQLFFEKGYALTTLDDVAQFLSVTKPSIYQHFSSKLELLSAVCGMTTAYASGIAQLALNETGSPRDRLSRLVTTLALEVMEGRIALAVCFREEKHLPPAGLRRLQDDRRRFNRALTLLLEEGCAKGEFTIGDVNSTSQAITGLTTWIFTWYRPNGPMSQADIAGEAATLALRLVGAKPL